MLRSENRERPAVAGVKPRTPLAWAVSALPLSYDSQTTTSSRQRPNLTVLHVYCTVVNASVVASFPGPAQVSVTCSTGPTQLSVACSTASDGKLGGAWERGYLSCTPGSHSVCAIRTLLRGKSSKHLLWVKRKILSIRKKPMLISFSHSKCSEHLASDWK